MRPSRAFTTLCAAACLVPSIAFAQGAISPGQTKNGILVEGQVKQSDGSYYDDWTFTGSAGQRIIVTMRSSTFDTYLNLGRGTGTGFTSMESNDDMPGGSTDSQIDYVLPSAGQYTIRANTLSEGATGAYTVTLEFSSGASVTQASSTSGGRSTADYLRPVFSELLGYLDSQSGASFRLMVTGHAREGASQTPMTLAVTAGTTYTVRGACDSDCSDLDVSIEDNGGKTIVTDTAADDHPTVSFKASTTGQVRVTISMATCKAAICYYGVVAVSH